MSTTKQDTKLCMNGRASFTFENTRLFDSVTFVLTRKAKLNQQKLMAVYHFSITKSAHF